MRSQASRTGASDSARRFTLATRRKWLSWGLVSLVAGPISSLRAQTPKRAGFTPDEEKVVAAIRDRARKAGLGGFEVKSSDHFLGVGDGPARYCAEALDRCESIARDHLAHFRKRGFKAAFPARRLTVVTLKDSVSYQALSGEEPDEAVGGHYDPEANWLVIFDFRPGQARQATEAKRLNTFTLVHETIHLLCYNTGLLAKQSDVPACISEGLATYGELWTPGHGASAFGAVNRPRLLALLQQGGQAVTWIPIARLLADDELFRKPETAQLAYAEAWLLVHFLMDTRERLPRFQAYLADMPRLDGPQTMSREKHAESRLGSLPELDLTVRRHAQRMGRNTGLRIPAGLTRAPG